MKISGLITMAVSLTISLVSAYCTVVGMGKVFASAALTTMGIASVIEIGRVVLLYDLHHYWNKLKFFQKVPGVLMLLIAMTLSAMGVYGFFANAHSQRTQEIIPIEMKIKEKQAEINIIKDAIEVNNNQLKQYDNKASDRYTELGYVSKAVALQKEQQKITNDLFNDNRKKQEQITVLSQEITKLQLEAEKKAPTLAHLKYYAKLFHVDDETAVIIFIVMIMMVFDTLAMYLMITSDWIMNNDLASNGEDDRKSSLIKVNNDESISKEFLDKIDKVDDKIIEKIKEIMVEYKPEPKVDNTSEDIKELKSLIQNISTTQADLSPLIQKVDSIKYSFNNENLFQKLTEIEKKINKNNIDEIAKGDILLTKLITSINDNEKVIDTGEFISYIKDNPDALYKLKKIYKKSPSVLSKLNKL
jgi:hypothetical protein